MKPLTPSTPHAIIVIGIPGAGKTAFSQQFSKTFKAPMVSSSLLEAVDALNSKAVLALNAILLTELLKTDRTIIIDGIGNRKIERTELLRKVSKAGYKPLLVWVQTDLVEARRRAGKTTDRSAGYKGDDYDEKLASFQPPTAHETPIVISGKHTYATQVKVVLKHLAQKRETAERVVIKSAPSQRPASVEPPKARPRSRNIPIR